MSVTSRQTPKDYESPLTKRLRQAMKERGTNARTVSTRAGCGATAVSDILNGRNKRPSASVLQNIATALSCPVDFFKDCVDDESPFVVPLLIEPNIEVVGVAETGAYREEEKDGAIIKKIAGPVNKRFPDATPYALEMRDKSMDRSEPFQLAPGAFPCFINIQDAGGLIEAGKIYVIRRRLAGSQSGTITETIIRRVVKKNGNGNGAMILRAESSEVARYPDVTVKNLSADTAQDVHVVGLVYAMQAYFD